MPLARAALYAVCVGYRGGGGRTLCSLLSVNATVRLIYRADSRSLQHVGVIAQGAED